MNNGFMSDFENITILRRQKNARKTDHLLTGGSMYKLRINPQKILFLKPPGTIAANSINNAIKLV